MTQTVGVAGFARAALHSPIHPALIRAGQSTPCDAREAITGGGRVSPGRLV
jgi:hypothetical protein